MATGFLKKSSEFPVNVVCLCYLFKFGMWAKIPIIILDK
jgi:hypothetical protein